ncbi:MAG: hypothetical protein K2L71_07950 [Muribaculaceae bacterium]|nr:hypothetical protein [Muribaculaceae bacterium]
MKKQKIQLTSSEEKRTVEPRDFTVTNFKDGCSVHGICPDGTPLECTGNVASGCSASDTSITCTNKHNISGVWIESTQNCPSSGSGSGSGSYPTNMHEACEKKSLLDECMWVEHGEEKHGRCVVDQTQLGRKLYCEASYGHKEKL